jgi:hypothetical protein
MFKTFVQRTATALSHSPVAALEHTRPVSTESASLTTAINATLRLAHNRLSTPKPLSLGEAETLSNITSIVHTHTMPTSIHRAFDSFAKYANIPKDPKARHLIAPLLSHADRSQLPSSTEHNR